MNTELLRIFYTANLSGRLELLPRLYTFIRNLKSLPVEDEASVMLCAVQPVMERVLLLDLGNSCDAEVWHCKETEGRSMLIGLDAMGYQAAHITSTLTEEARTRLRQNLMGMALVDADHPWEADDIVCSSRGLTGCKSYLNIVLSPANATLLDGNRLQLAAVRAGQLGMAQIINHGGRPVLQAQGQLDLPASATPDPTIAGTVEFILSEAQYHARRQS